MLIIPYIFFFNDTATTEIYTLSLHDALPISAVREVAKELLSQDKAKVSENAALLADGAKYRELDQKLATQDRKSTRLNSSHRCISYAVFCLKKKKKNRK